MTYVVTFQANTTRFFFVPDQVDVYMQVYTYDGDGGGLRKKISTSAVRFMA